MVMRTDNFSAGGALVGKHKETTMAKKTPVASSEYPSRTHAEVMGEAAHGAMRHLGKTGQQMAHVGDVTAFAELQDEGPTARAPEDYHPAKQGQ